MRELISRSFKRFNRERSGVHRVTLRELDSAVSGIEEIKGEARQTSDKYMADEIYAAKLPVVTLCYLTLAALEGVTEKRIVGRDFPANDYQLGCMLTGAVNSSVCIISLVRDGFDTQARILLRSLNESLYQTLILLSDARDFEAQKKAEDHAAAREIHYELFGKKKRLFRKLSALEQRLGMPRARAEQLEAWRKNAMEFYSETTHHGVLSTFWGAMARGFERDQMYPAIMGHAGPAGRSTVRHLTVELCHFCRTLHELLLKVHHWIPDQRAEWVVRYLAMHRMLIDVDVEGLATAKGE